MDDRTRRNARAIVACAAVIAAVSAGCQRQDPDNRDRIGGQAAERNADPSRATDAPAQAGAGFVTLTGCVRHDTQRGEFWLGDVADESGAGAGTMGTSGTSGAAPSGASPREGSDRATSDAGGITLARAASYRLVGGSELNLQNYLGERVRITGEYATPVPAATTGEPVDEDDPGTLGRSSEPADRGRDATTGAGDGSHGAAVARAIKVTDVRRAGGECTATR